MPIFTWSEAIYVTVYRKTGHNAAPFEKFFLHLQSCRCPDIELSKFYRLSLRRSHYNRPNRSLPSAWNNTFLRNWSIFSRYLRTPCCARFYCRRSHIITHMHIHTHGPHTYIHIHTLVRIHDAHTHSHIHMHTYTCACTQYVHAHSHARRWCAHV